MGNTSDKPSWDELFLLMAAIMSSRGSCDRLRTACVLVKNNKIVGAGYNGSVAGADTCDDVGHLMIEGHCKRTQHGERNAIDNSVADINGATAYVVATPCIDCIKSMLQMGVKRIVFVGSYRNSTNSAYNDFVRGLCERKEVEVVNHPDPKILLDILVKTLSRLQGPGGVLSGLDKIDLLHKKI